MESRVTKIESNIDSLFRDMSRQEKIINNLTRLTTTMEVLVREMEYMRNDVREIKDDSSKLKTDLLDHTTGDIRGRLSGYDGYKKQVIGWVIIFILGLVSSHLIK